MWLLNRPLLPPGSRLPSQAPNATSPLNTSRVFDTCRVSRCRHEVLVHARRKTTEGSSAAAGDDNDEGEGAPQPAKAKKKGRKSKTEMAEAAAAAAAAEAEAAVALADAGSWVDAVAGGEEDRRRFPYHRRLQTAASEGNVEAAEAAFASMQAVGLEPGPRAFHVLLCAHLKAGDMRGALEVTGRATQAEVSLLAESYAVLIYAVMEANPPDVAVAKALYGALPGTDTDPQLPWSTLCRLLAAKGFGADAVAAVREGLRAGLELYPEVAEAYVKALCDTKQSDAALSFLESMGPRYGLKPDARHVTYVVAAFAASGALDDASSLIDAAGNRGWGRNAAMFNALVSGIISRLDNDPDGTLAMSFSRMTGRMVQSGVRPNKFTFKLETEGLIKLGDARAAMGSLKSLRTAAGTGGCRLLDSSSLSGLLHLLSERDMPVDMLQLLVNMSEDGCRMPPGALAPDGSGRSPLDSWLLGHMEALAARAEQRESAAAMLEAPLEYVNGIPLGPGLCVVDDEGRVVPVAKCTIKQLRAEAEARGVTGVKDMKKPELVDAVKAARSRLPFNVLHAQVKPAAAGGQAATVSSRRKASAKAAVSVRKRSSRAPMRQIWSISPETGEVDILQAPPDSAFMSEAEKFLLADSALEDLDLTDDQFMLASNKNIKDINFDALLEARMLDEGTAAVMNVGDEDVMSGFATLLPGQEDEEDEGADDEEGAVGRGGSARGDGELDEAAWRKMQSYEARSIDPQSLQEGYRQLQFLESQQLDTDEANLVAGMDVAMDIVRAAEIVGGVITSADLLTLTAGALAERNANAAADIARRLPALLKQSAAGTAVQYEQQQQYEPAFVLQQYEQLADMCLQQRAVMQADVVLESAEVAGLKPSKEVLARLTAALRGQPRRSERLGRENAELLERAGVNELDQLTSEDLQLPSQQQQQQLVESLPSSSSSTTAAAEAAAAVPAVPATEVSVEALSATEQPLDDGDSSSSSSSSSQPQQQQGGQFDELPEDLQEVAEVFADMMAWSDRQDKMRAAMRKTGMSDDDIDDIINHPAALMSDMSWLPGFLLVRDGPGDDGVADDVIPGEQGSADDDEDSEFNVMDLARAAAENRLTPKQTDWILDSFGAAGLPLLFDDSSQQIIWPGTDEYHEWAAEAPQEAEEDTQAMSAAFQEVFAEELAEAAQAAGEMDEAEGQGVLSLDPDSPEVRDWMSLKQQYKEVLTELGLASDGQESAEQATAAASGEESEGGVAVAQRNADKDKLMQVLQQHLKEMVSDQQGQIKAAFEEMGLPVPDLELDGADGSSDSSKQKQLT